MSITNAIIIGGGVAAGIWALSKIPKSTQPGDKDPAVEPVEPVKNDTQPNPLDPTGQKSSIDGFSAKYPSGTPTDTVWKDDVNCCGGTPISTQTVEQPTLAVVTEPAKTLSVADPILQQTEPAPTEPSGTTVYTADRWASLSLGGMAIY